MPSSTRSHVMRYAAHAVLLMGMLTTIGCLGVYYERPDAPPSELAVVTGRNIRIMSIDGRQPYAGTAPPVHLLPGEHTLRVDIIDPNMVGATATVAIDVDAARRYGIYTRRYILWNDEIHSERYFEATNPRVTVAELARGVRDGAAEPAEVKWFPYVKELQTGRLVSDTDPERARGTRALLAYLAWQDSLVRKGGKLTFPIDLEALVEPRKP